MRSIVVLCICLRALTSILNAAGPADSAWSQLQELKAKADEKVPIGTNAVEFYAGREKSLHDAATEFAQQFPNDAHKSQALFWKIATTDFEGSIEQRTAQLQQNETDGRSILADTALPQDLRFQVQRTIFSQWLDNSDVITTPTQAAEIEERIAELARANPTVPRAVSLKLGRAKLLLRFDHQKGLEALQDLVSGPDQNLADAARAQLFKAQMIGKPVDLQFTALDGSAVDMRALRGTIILVDFWASWCPDCLRDLPALRRTYQKYKDKGFTVIGISLDKDEQALSNFVAKKLIPWPQYFDGQGWQSPFAMKYGVRAIPEMWLINQRGEVVSTDISAEQLDQRIEQLISSGGELSRN
jgi:thiol-disulfide isomerase/thioredoxin